MDDQALSNAAAKASSLISMGLISLLVDKRLITAREARELLDAALLILEIRQASADTQDTAHFQAVRDLLEAYLLQLPSPSSSE